MTQFKPPLFKTILFATAMFLVTQLYSQNYIYKGTQQIPSTSTWRFTTSGGISGSLEVTVAKSRTNAYMMLAIDVPVPQFAISGSVYLILQNGNMIVLNSRVAKDHVDNQSKVLFNISSANYTLLQKNDIMKIRFTIGDSMMKTKENYTANNEYSKYSTAIEINALKD
ncbi:MAG: hypothetical protein ABIO79_02325 [Ferruginibacter sp.]